VWILDVAGDWLELDLFALLAGTADQRREETCVTDFPELESQVIGRIGCEVVAF
jgi:hypothetical protein